MYEFVKTHWADMLVIGHFLINAILGLRVIYSRRSTGAALGWLVFLFAVPYIGLIMYLLIGETRIGNKRMKRQKDINAFYHNFYENNLPDEAKFQKADNLDKRFAQISNLVRKYTTLDITLNNSTKLLNTTDEMLEAFLQEINSAKHTCLMMFYIVDVQGRVVQVLEALIAASQRGIHCKLLVDAVGSKDFLKSEWPQKLRDAGVLVTAALPVGPIKTFFVRSDLRNHRKLVVIDYKVGYTGSYNLVDPKFFKTDSGVGEWVDTLIQVKGPAVVVLSAVFYADWAVENRENFDKTLTFLNGYLKSNPPKLSIPESKHSAQLQVIPSAPNDQHYVVYDTLVTALFAAQKNIVFTTPYFVPDDTFLLALQTAAQRGVRVVMILPEKVDSWLVSKASRAYYSTLLRSGVEIALYAKGLLHSKTLVVDEEFAIYGTVNMDMRSFYINMELSLGIYDKDTVATVAELQNSYLKNCQAVELKAWEKQPKLQHFIERCARLVSPLL